MKQKYLFPHKFKALGWVLFILGVLLGIIVIFFNVEPDFLYVKVFSILGDTIFSSTKEREYFKITETNLIDELASVFAIAGGLIVAFSEAKNEDEFIRKIRSDSLIWALFANYILLLLAVLFVYGEYFLQITWINLVSPLILFILKFHWELYKLKKESK